MGFPTEFGTHHPDGVWPSYRVLSARWQKFCRGQRCGSVAALARGNSGERYLLAGENYSYAEFYRLLAERTGHCQHLIHIPAWSLRIIGAIGDLLGKAGLRSEVSRTNMRILCIGNYYTNAKSIRELELHYRPLAEAIDEAVAWFRLHGMLPK